MIIEDIMLSQRILFSIIIGTGLFSIGISYGTLTQSTSVPDSFDHAVKMSNGVPIFWQDNATSVSRTDITGNTTGPFLNLNGGFGTVFRTTGNIPQARIDTTGVFMYPGKAFSWGGGAVTVNRTDTTGQLFGNYLAENGFSGIIFKTAIGTERMRIVDPSGNVGINTNNPTEKLDVRGNIALSGNITSTPVNELVIKTTNNKDICIGTGC